MSTHDIVAELDALAARLSSWGENRDVADRARDEIVALRRARETLIDNRNLWLLSRAEALEQAAQMCDDTASKRPSEFATAEQCAANIRALKERPHE